MMELIQEYLMVANFEVSATSLDEERCYIVRQRVILRLEPRIILDRDTTL